MKKAMQVFAASLLLALSAAAADEAPVPRMFKGMQKGQWKADVQSSASKPGKAMPSMVVCTDNLMQHSSAGAKAPESACKRRLVKDTASEAVMETTCPERTSTVTMRREDAKNVLITIDSTGKRGPTSMKIHYTYLGACTAGQGTVSYDKNSDQCKRINAAVAKMDPEKQREQIAKMKAMCPQ